LDVFMGQWKLLRTRMTVEEFDAAWVVLDAQLNQVMRNYFHKEWLPYRENFVHAWTKHFRHYGHWVDSRIESMHSHMKRHLGRGTHNDFHGLLLGLANYTAQQLDQLRNAESSDAVRVPVRFNVPVFQFLVRRISARALGVVHDLVLQARASLQNNEPLAPCKGDFECMMGMPCVHKCHVALTGGPPLVPEDFCIQWRLTIRNNGEPLNRVAMQVMPPVKRKKRKVNGKRTASQARTKASTGRILSGFERLQGVLPPAAVEAPAPTTPPV
jgi:hypothetical protein